MKRLALAGATALALVVGLGSAQAQEKQQMAFVVNAASDFWKLAEAGVKKAQAELPDFELQFRYPAQGTAALQNALMDDLVAAGTDAIMISSVDPKTSTDAFNRIAAQVPLFTTDSDAPQSDRIAYIGSSNTEAGVQAGEIALKALPEGRPQEQRLLVQRGDRHVRRGLLPRARTGRRDQSQHQRRAAGDAQRRLRSSSRR